MAEKAAEDRTRTGSYGESSVRYAGAGKRRTPPGRRRENEGRRGRGTWIGVLAVLALSAGYGLLFAWPVSDGVETGQSAAWPDLQPQAFSSGVERVGAGVEEELDAAGYLVEERRSSESDIEIMASRPGRFVRPRQEVRARVEANGSGGAVVHVRVHAPERRLDLGSNARAVRELQAGIARNVGLRSDATARGE